MAEPQHDCTYVTSEAKGRRAAAHAPEAESDGGSTDSEEDCRRALEEMSLS